MTTGTPGQGARGRFGKYEVLAHLATGGMGAVYRARDTETGGEVALKILPPELAAKPALRERFKREARAVAGLSHENIVALHEFGEINDLLFLALEYVDGIDLHHYVERRGPLEADEARAILTQAARALAYFHEQGLVHRDIKPANFLIAHPDGRLLVKLTDLGLARAQREGEFRVTRAGRTVGTIDYMAPEQARDSGRADIRSDLYALGCTLYHMLTGHAPFPDGSLSERVYKHAESDPTDITALRPAVPADLAAVLRRLLRKDPADRFQTPEDLLDALENPQSEAEAAEGPRVGILVAVKSSSHLKIPRTAVPKPSAGPRRPAAARPPATGRRWRRWLLDGAALVTALAITAVVWWHFSAATAPPEDPQETDAVPAAPPKKEPKPVRKQTPEPVKKPIPVEDVPKQEGPRAFTLATAFAGATLHQDHAAALAGFPEPARDVPVLRVGRGAGHPYRTVADAWARLPADRPAVIEIHDPGPLAVGPLPPRTGHGVLLRAGAGHRPLLTWDGTGAPALLTVQRGDLLLDGLDVVFQAAAPGPEPAVLCQVTDGNFGARHCTFTCVSAPARVLTVVRLQGAAQARLERCFGRGVNLTAVHAAGTAAEVLFDGCLFYTEGPPLLDVSGPDQAPVTLRVVRSTLVAGQAFLRLRPEPGGGGLPRLHGLGWDALVARCGPQPRGDFLALPDPQDVAKVNWQSLNCVYTGWDMLEPGPHARVLPDAWPKTAPHPEAVAPAFFDPRGTAVDFAAAFGPGPVGCELSRVPPGVRPSAVPP